MTGTELTILFFKACGKDLSVNDEGEPVVWIDGPDYTQPGHLETVIGMVRERWPDDHQFTMSRCECRTLPEPHWAVVLGDLEEGGEPLAEVVMLAAIQAARLQPQEPAE